MEVGLLCCWLGVVGLNQIDQCLPWHHRLRFGQELLAFGALLGRAQLIVREADLLAANQPSPGQRSQGNFRADWVGLPESP